ncbi:MAG TPA: arginine deiminase family protein [Vicinamibacterales bacterium]|nr:arginine deiminase family protein [Vicinamibacterales bacterium]
MIAITRPVSDSLASCELTHLERQPIDVDRARAQHRAYEEALEDAGCAIVRVDAAPELPDAVFVEDTAVVLPEVAIVTRPGAPSRRLEVPPIAAVLGRYRELVSVEPPATLDGGDVLVLGRHVYVGRSRRTSDGGIAQLRRILMRYGYEVVAVEVAGCLHLKSAATAIADDRLLVNPAWVAVDAFAGAHLLSIDPDESQAANALRAGEMLVYPSAFPRTRDTLVRAGHRVREVDVSELAKAEGAVTCCSVMFDAA